MIWTKLAGRNFETREASNGLPTAENVDDAHQLKKIAQPFNAGYETDHPDIFE